nr:uncharacterized protein LOC129155169 [Nothobranchius furzeri]
MTDQIFSIAPPGNFNFEEPSSWPQWIRRFERFRWASGLDGKAEDYQVNSLLYVMGDRSDDILGTLPLSDQQKAVYADVTRAFGEHFIGKHNVIYERAKFNSRQQQQGESAEIFITDVHKLAEHCKFGALMEEMIRDCIVVGIRDSRLSERLQLDPHLTLAKTITQVRQQEEIKKQQQLLRGGHTESKGANVDAINTNRGRPHYRQTPPRRPEQFMSIPKASDKSHYEGKFCRSSQRVETLVESDPEEDIAFMGSVNTDETEEEWLKKLSFNGENVTFKLDTGASVTAVPASMYSEVRDGSLLAPSKKIKGPDDCPLKVLGVMRAHIKSEKTETRQDVYVVSNLVMPLMGLPAIIKLNLIKQVASVQQEKQEKCHQYKTMFPKVFTGLGKLEGAYKIKLKEGAVPYALSAPRRVPLPMKEQVKQELERMEAMGVIRRIEEPTAWCAGMVVVPKPNKKPRICVDLTRLNENVCRERHILPAVDDTLAQLEGAKVFSKLDATSGFWQVPLHKDSQPLTTFITPFGRYCFQRLPFGISSAPEHFQLRILQIIAGEKGALCHADDILVFGKDKAEHDERLQQVLKRCEKAGLTLNEKCEFSVERVKFLGHNISATRIEADPDKISAIENMPEPQNVEEVRRFLGMVNYVGKFSSSLPALTKPLRDLLKILILCRHSAAVVLYNDTYWTSNIIAGNILETQQTLIQ